MKQINREMIRMIMNEMPEQKKQQYKNACVRNGLLTSSYNLPWASIRVYKEGWYVEFEGTRSRFAVFAKDNDGEIEIIRKPNENKLHFIYADGGQNELYFDEIF